MVSQLGVVVVGAEVRHQEVVSHHEVALPVCCHPRLDEVVAVAVEHHHEVEVHQGWYLHRNVT